MCLIQLCTYDDGSNHNQCLEWFYSKKVIRVFFLFFLLSSLHLIFHPRFLTAMINQTGGYITLEGYNIDKMVGRFLATILGNREAKLL